MNIAWTGWSPQNSIICWHINHQTKFAITYKLFLIHPAVYAKTGWCIHTKEHIICGLCRKKNSKARLHSIIDYNPQNKDLMTDRVAPVVLMDSIDSLYVMTVRNRLYYISNGDLKNAQGFGDALCLYPSNATVPEDERRFISATWSTWTPSLVA